MQELGVKKLYDLSHMIPRETNAANGAAVSRSWVLVYRDLCEWAVLFERITRAQFATDTLIVRDGVLRSKAFRGDLFIKLRTRMSDAFSDIRRRTGRKIYLVGVAKHSEVLRRYALAAVDIADSQMSEHAVIFGHLLSDVYGLREGLVPGGLEFGRTNSRAGM